MRSLWSDADADAFVARYSAQGVEPAIALRVYSARLLGGDPALVLHGGGNCSVKSTARDALGATVPVVCVKGSGWDLASIEPAGFPALRLEPLRRLLAAPALSDEQMVSAHRGNLLDAAAPTPSVETLLHAFLEHTFVDHTHANAVLAVTNHPDGAAISRDTFGARAAIVPYVAPGFALARAVAAAARQHPHAAGIVLLKHGIISFAATARESYERMIELVSVAEDRLGRGRRALAVNPGVPATATVADIAPILRGLTAVRRPGHGDGDIERRFILRYRTSQRILQFVNGADVARYSRAGMATPDHVVWIKPWACILPTPRREALDRFRDTARAAVETFAAEYQAYFDRHNAGCQPPRLPYDPMPRLLLVPGMGAFVLGHSRSHADASADVAEAAVQIVLDGESIARYEGVSGQEIFDIEYWALEQARMRRAPAGRLAQHVVVITGGAGTIGAATARAFAAEGAEVALLDCDGAAAAAVAAEVSGIAITCDVTRPPDVAAALDAVCEAFGGLDIVVSNAGAAWQGAIGDVSDEVLRRSFELNFFAHQTVAAGAVAIMRRQDIGGCLLFNVSKQAINPGPGLGPYGLPKAATLALLRQYAIEYGGDGIRANGVNADRIRGQMLTDEMIKARAKARGVSEHEYMRGNLLGREVRAEDVAQAFVSLALARATTGAVLTVDGGNIAAALR